MPPRPPKSNLERACTYVQFEGGANYVIQPESLRIVHVDGNRFETRFIVNSGAGQWHVLRLEMPTEFRCLVRPDPPIDGPPERMMDPEPPA